MQPRTTVTDGTDMAKKIVSGRYRVERAVARTGAGVLYEATELTSTHGVGLEVASALPDDDARARFTRDAMAAQRLEGDHVLGVLDVGHMPDGTPFAVREPAIASLAMEIRSRGHVSLEQAVAWTLEACEAVAEAHALGMAHGDLRPETVMLARSEQGTLVAKVVWTSAAKAERVAREDVQRDVAGLAELLRALATGARTPRGAARDAEGEPDDDDTTPTLPTPIAHAITQAATGQMKSVGELAEALAPYAPFGHPSARNVAFILSRAGIAPTAPRTNPLPPPTVPTITRRRERVAKGGRDDELRDSRPSMAPERKNHTVAFTLVALALIGAAAILTGVLYRRGDVRWTGVSEDATAMTYVTSAELYGSPGETESEAARVTREGIVERSWPLAADALSRLERSTQRAQPDAAEQTPPLAEPPGARSPEPSSAPSERPAPSAAPDDKPLLPPPPTTVVPGPGAFQGGARE